VGADEICPKMVSLSRRWSNRARNTLKYLAAELLTPSEKIPTKCINDP
jgi:hypothetical protein